MPWFFAVAESDHAIQNPTSAEKVRQVGEHLRVRMLPGDLVGRRVAETSATFLRLY
jgi:hypothetical protein